MAVYPDAVDVGTLGIHPTNPANLNSANAKDAQLRLRDEGGGPEAGQHWRFATGTYEFAEPLTIVRRIWLEGPSGSGRSSQAHLSFPAGSGGLVFDGQLLSGALAGGARASNLRIKSAKGGGVGHGVIITASSVHLTGLYVTGFRGDGIHVLGDTNISNADNFYLERVDVYDCGESLDVERLEAKESVLPNLNALRVEITTKTAHRLKKDDRFLLQSSYWHHEVPYYDPDKLPHPKLFHCGNYIVTDASSAKTFIAETTDELYLSPEAKSFYTNHPVAQDSYTIFTGHGLTTRGGDSNTGNIVACQFQLNTGWGVLEHSFHGNTYVGCVSDGNILGPYRSVNRTSYSVFLGCYAEGFSKSVSTPSIIGPQTVMRGGTHSVPIKRVGLQASPLVGQSRFIYPLDEPLGLEHFTSMGNRHTDYHSEPRDGDCPARTWERGDLVRTFAALPGSTFEGFICEKSGSFTAPRTLPRVNADGTRVVRTKDFIDVPSAGEWVEINGVRARIERNVAVGDEEHFVMSEVIPRGQNLAMTFAFPVFRKFGVVT